MKLQNLRPGLPERPQMDLECALATMTDPFSLNGTPQRLSAFMTQHSVLPNEVLLTNQKQKGWSNYANNESLIVQIDPESELRNPISAILSQE